MGADTVQNPFAYLAFSKTHALSPRGRCRPFDAAADGIVLSEGIGVVVLKRLADAERDGDRIYAVIKGVGASSDGRDKGLTAPRPEGQVRALRAGLRQGRRLARPRVGLVEAHGTGTVVGDQTEVQAPGRGVRARPGGRAGSCALGLGQVDDRPHQVRRRARRADQDGAGPAPQGAAADARRRRRPNPKADLDDGPASLEHRGPAVAPRRRGPPAPRRRQRLRVRRHQLPRRARGVHRRLPAGPGRPSELAGRAVRLAAADREALVPRRRPTVRDALSAGAKPALQRPAADDAA